MNKRSSPHTAVSAAVIAGGANRRMGRPKGLLEIEGVPLITRVADALSRISDDTICVTCRPEEYRFEAHRLRFVPDYGELPQGPLSGIMGALAHARCAVCIVVAVDMPFLNPALLRHLADQAAGADVVLPVIESDRPEPLHAVYRTTCLPFGVAALEAGHRKVTSFFNNVTVRRVMGTELRTYDPELASFANVNTPREFARAMAALNQTGSRVASVPQ